MKISLTSIRRRMKVIYIIQRYLEIPLSVLIVFLNLNPIILFMQEILWYFGVWCMSILHVHSKAKHYKIRLYANSRSNHWKFPIFVQISDVSVLLIRPWVSTPMSNQETFQNLTCGLSTLRNMKINLLLKPLNIFKLPCVWFSVTRWIHFS